LTSLCVCGATTVKRRRRRLGLKGSRVEKDKSPNEYEQLVLKQLDRDIANRQGVKTIMEKVAFNEGVHLSRYGDR
jgi:hypothetical protein